MKKIARLGYGLFTLALSAPFAVFARYGVVPDTGDSYEEVAADAGMSLDPIGYILTTIMNWILGILGLGAVISFVIAGFLYLTAAGDESKTEQSKNLMKYAIIAVVVALIGYIVINTVVALVGGEADGGAY
ncbi:MAG TPA: hypothetical protein VN420_00595 [Candidatus Fimivivens sp.]|nr:hypothetical protein [Candidatus Fimivivens sp.]